MENPINLWKPPNFRHGSFHGSLESLVHDPQIQFAAVWALYRLKMSLTDSATFA